MLHIKHTTVMEKKTFRVSLRGTTPSHSPVFLFCTQKNPLRESNSVKEVL